MNNMDSKLFWITEMTWLEEYYNAFITRMLRPTDEKSRREEGKSDYIVEFWCTISNIGFFLVGIYFCEPLIIFSGVASALSHAFPRQGLHDLDILAVIAMGTKITLNLGVFISHPGLLLIATATILVNVIDTICSRNNYQKIGPWLHVLWHLTAAASMFVFYTAIGLTSIFSIGLPLIVPILAFGSLILGTGYLIKLGYEGRNELVQGESLDLPLEPELDRQESLLEHRWEGNIDNTAVIYYQGKDSSQFQATRYLGGRPMVASTGEVAQLKYQGINTIMPQSLWTYPEIEEIDKKPSFSIISRIKFWWKGISLSSSNKNTNPYTPLYPTNEDGSVFAYSINNDKRSLGQATDIVAHKKKYDTLVESHPERKNIICYGVSRGSATTFSAIANNQYTNVKLCVLEAPPGSIRNLVKEMVPFGLGKWLYNSFLSKWLFGNKHETDKGAQAQAYVDKFPLDIPLVVISSKPDSTVPHDNSLKLAQMVAHRRIKETQNGSKCAPVYFIQLDASNHDDYFRQDKSPDAARYQNILHAIYKRHNLPHIPDLAKLGEKEIDDMQLTKGMLAEQVEFQAQHKKNKLDRAAIKEKAIEHLYHSGASLRQLSICSKLRMYHNHHFTLFNTTSINNQNKDEAELSCCKKAP